MKFRCERDVLVDALATAGRAAANRGNLQILTGIHLELTGDRLRFTGSDVDLTITVDRIVDGGGDGVAVLPAKLASDIVRAFGPGAVAVEIDADEAHLSAGRSEFSLRLMSAEEYPHFEPPSAEAITIDADVFAVALKQVVPAASGDDSRPILTGVLMAAEGDGLRLVATDSYRLAVRDLPGVSVLSEGQSVLVPSRALNELGKILAGGKQLMVRFGTRDASFEVDGTRLTTRLIEGEFPNYRGLIPQNHPNRLTVDRAAVLEALRRVRLLAQDATPVRAVMHDGTVELMAITQEIGQAHDELDATYVGQELTVAFNPAFLMEGIEVSGGEQITLETIDALKPAVIRAVDVPEFLYLLMPVRVS